jgi:hypothetical protein
MSFTSQREVMREAAADLAEEGEGDERYSAMQS